MDVHELIAAAEQVEKNLRSIRTRVEGVVMFVDLVGSTDYKAQHSLEEEWLPRLATFLVSMTHILQTHGRVIKYIGDEVMAFFEGPTAVLNAEHAAEQILQFCSEFKKYSFKVKIALDYGRVSMLDFDSGSPREKGIQFGSQDPNGLTVDRCARIMSKTVANTVLCSGDFRSASAAKKRWRSAGTFHPKGIQENVKVYQLCYGDSVEVRVRDEKMTLPECLKLLDTAQKHLAETKDLYRHKSKRTL